MYMFYKALLELTSKFKSYKKILKTKQKIRNFLKERKEIFLDLGAGNKPGKGNWLTIDMTPLCDIYWNLLDGLPFPDESISQIYSSHFFEHLSFQEGQMLFKECYRVLAKGGIFKICVPNSEPLILSYTDSSYLEKHKLQVRKNKLNNTTKIDFLNLCYLDEHKYMFDIENLLFILNAVGFRNVRERRFDPAIDHNTRESWSIHAEAEK